jgi:hypothetical protein
MSSTKRTFEFTFVLGGIDELTEEMADAFYEAGCDDSTLAVIHGVPEIHFSREADSFPEALYTAIRDVERVMEQFPNLKITSIQYDEYAFFRQLEASFAQELVPSLDAWKRALSTVLEAQKDERKGSGMPVG